MTRILMCGALAALVVAAGCGERDAAATNGGDSGMAAMAGGGGAAADSGARALDVPAAERARLGITLATAEQREIVGAVRLVGRVVPAETAVRTVTLKVDGFVERLFVDFTGREVRRGEPLLELYSPMLVAAQQELLLALRLRQTLGAAAGAEAVRNADSLVAAGRHRFAYWDVGDDLVLELERSGAVQRTMVLRAPENGFVLQKNVVQGQAVMAGAPLFQIADLTTVWLEADVFEQDLRAVRTGLAADVTFDAYPGEVRRGRVTYVYPTLDPVARTGRVRVELSNADGRARPGLFGTARIVTPLGIRGVVIPRQAALVTGDRQLVFVEDSLGRLVPRLVTLGAETDSLVEVRAGLRAGERVVASAAFLLDAESNLGAAMAGMAGMDMGSGGTGARGLGGTERPRPPAPQRDTTRAMPGMPDMPEHRD